MKYTIAAPAALALLSSTALAGGIDRSGQGVNILFEEGNYAQFSFSHVDPDVNGSSVPLFGASTDVAQSYSQTSFGYKHELSDNLDLALIIDQPFGAHILYEDGPFSENFASGGLPYNGTADIESHAITGLLQYHIGNGFSIHGGVRAQKVEGIIESGDGGLDAESDYNFGGVIGAAYQIPDIALRVALTYSAPIDNSFEATQRSIPEVAGNAPGTMTSFDVEFPESVNLDFQTGIAPKTLLFGNVRWVGWGGFNLTTPDIGSGETNWVDFDDDTLTYELGIGRQVNEKLSLAVSLGFEEPGDRPSTTALAPTTGSRSVGVAATYQVSDALSVSGGVRYAEPGDQYVNSAAGPVYFEDNSAIAAGIRIGYHF